MELAFTWGLLREGVPHSKGLIILRILYYAGCIHWVLYILKLPGRAMHWGVAFGILVWLWVMDSGFAGLNRLRVEGVVEV